MNELLIQPTGQPSRILSSEGSVTISIPIQIRRRCGRKQIILTSGEQSKSATQMPPPTSLQFALARGHRWLKMLGSGEVTSLKAIAAIEQVDDRYVSRMVCLTTLDPQLVDAILDNEVPEDTTVLDLLEIIPILWGEQTLAKKSLKAHL